MTYLKEELQVELQKITAEKLTQFINLQITEQNLDHLKQVAMSSLQATFPGFDKYFSIKHEVNPWNHAVTLTIVELPKKFSEPQSYVLKSVPIKPVWETWSSTETLAKSTTYTYANASNTWSPNWDPWVPPAPKSTLPMFCEKCNIQLGSFVNVTSYVNSLNGLAEYLGCIGQYSWATTRHYGAIQILNGSKDHASIKNISIKNIHELK